MMELIIHRDKTLAQLQQEFTDYYPYLKIEFYKKKHGEGVNTRKAEKLSEEQKVGDVQTMERSGTINIDGDVKVSELEKAFQQEYGLPVQVFRKSFHIWIQTSKTDNWTLTRQNEMGKQINGHISDDSEPEDYHEQL